MKLLLTVVLFGGLTIVEVLAYFTGSVWKEWGFILWILTGLVSIGASVFLVGKIIWSDIRSGDVLFWTVFIAVASVTFLVNYQFFYVNHESTQQLAGAFSSLELPGFNYTGTAFLGYPVRQYFLAVLPSLLVGRSPFLIGLGYNWLFLLGMVTWYAGLRRLWNGEKGVVISGLTLVALWLSPYVLMYVRLSEQSILPLSFTMFALGWFLYFWRTKSVLSLIPLVWFGCLLGTSYTPTLASWLLLLGVLVLSGLALVRERRWGLLGGIVAAVITVSVFGGLSFKTRTDIFKPDRMERAGLPFEEHLRQMAEGYTVYFGFSSSYFWPAFVGILVVGMLGWCAIGKQGILGILVSGWVVGVIGMSVYLAGYADPNPTFSLHRALITIPLVLTLAGTILYRWWSERFVTHLRRMGEVFAVLVVGMVCYRATQGLPYGYNQPLMTLTDDVLTTLASKRVPPTLDTEVVLVQAQQDLISLEFILPYFYPQAQVSYGVERCETGEAAGVRLIYTDVPECIREMSRKKVAGASSFTYEFGGQLKTVTKVFEE